MFDVICVYGKYSLFLMIVFIMVREIMFVLFGLEMDVWEFLLNVRKLKNRINFLRVVFLRV